MLTLSEFDSTTMTRVDNTKTIGAHQMLGHHLDAGQCVRRVSCFMVARFLLSGNARKPDSSGIFSKGVAVDSSFSTDDLIARSSAGDDDAKSRLFDRYRERIKFLVRVRLGGKLRQKVESSDIAQEVFLKGLQGCSSDPGSASRQAFFSHIARNVHHVICDQAAFWNADKRDMTRERSLQQTLGSDSRGALDIPDPKNDHAPIELLQVAEEVEQLVVALGQLAEQHSEYWELIIATKIEGRSFQQVAQENNLTIGAAKMKTKRAMLKLAEIYRSVHNNRS